MPLIRWLDNVPTGEETPGTPLPGLLLSCVVAFLVGQFMQNFGVGLVRPGMSGAFITTDLIAMACGVPVLLLAFRPTAARARQEGTFGLFHSILLAIVILLLSNLAVFFVLFVLVLGPSGGSGDLTLVGYLLMSLNIAVTYGLPLGLSYWLRLARMFPKIHRMTLAPPTEGFWLWPAALLILGLWQVAIWKALQF